MLDVFLQVKQFRKVIKKLRKWNDFAKKHNVEPGFRSVWGAYKTVPGAATVIHEYLEAGGWLILLVEIGGQAMRHLH